MAAPDGITVALSLGPAVITGMVGYFAARQQSQVLIRQTREETERLRIDHAETSRRRRESVYRDLLSLMHRLDLMIGGFGREEDGDLEDWLNDFQTLWGAIALCGGPDVRAALAEVQRTVDDVGQAARSGPASSFDALFAKAYRANHERLAHQVEDLIDAMRADVSPSSPVAL
jgi:hypothetical protein